MTPEQLAAARATQWRQDAQPLLTFEDASNWLERMQLALYLPRKAHVLAPAPSFVEAVAGAGSATPAPDAIAQAHALLVRLVAEGSVVPLNLFGTPGEQPDFLVATQALPHLAALQGDRNWKKPPSRTGPGKVSPLAIEIWKLLDSDHGVLTANEIRSQLGHELTEAATIRGLSELWQNLRVAPFPQADGEPAHWQILSLTHKKEMAAGGTMSQSAALSMLVSIYLQSIVTGTAEDIEAFLSPVASRSRLRDVIRGLTATRQLKSLSMDAQTFFFIEGTLPDMPEVVVVSAEAAEAKPAFMGRSAYRERMLNRGKEDEEKPAENAGDAQRRTPFRPSSAPRRFAAGSGSGTFRKRPVGGGARDSRSSGHSSPGQFSAPRRSYGANQGGFDRDSAGRPPFRRSEGGDSGSRPSFSRPRPEGAGSDRPFTPRTGASRPPYGSRPAFGRDRSGPPRPFTPRAEGDRPSFKPRSDYGASSGKPGGYSKDRGRPSFGSGRSSEGGARPFRPRPEGDRPRSGTGRPFTPREGGRPAFSDRAKPFSGGAKPYGDRPKPYSDRPKPYSDRPRPSFEKDGDASGKNSSRAGFMSRAGSRPGRPTGDRPRPDRAPGDRPSAGRPRPARAGGDRPYAPRPSAGRPAAGAPRSFTPRPSGDRGKPGEGHLPPKFDAKPSYQRRDSASPRGSDGSRRSDGPRSDSRPPRREGGSSGYPSNPNRPSRAPKAVGSFVKRDGGGRPASGRPASGSGGRPPARVGKPGFGSRPPSRGSASPGRNPGGTGRPSGPRVGGGRPSSGRSSSGRPGGSSRPGSSRPGASRPGGMKPPTRKPRPEKDSE